MYIKIYRKLVSYVFTIKSVPVLRIPQTLYFMTLKQR